jgi:two-component system LytT family response regulator
MTIRTLIVDDEPLGRGGISARLQNEADIEIIGECANGRLAVAAIRQYSPDLLFLDVQMPGMSGFEVLQTAGADAVPVVIFVTAFDEYALRAFEVHALDYLLKPIDDERFRLALQRARTHLRQKTESALGQRLTSLLSSLSSNNSLLPKTRERFVIKSSGRISFIKAEEVDWIEAVGDYARLHVGKQAHLIRETMSALATELDARFLRIHRSLIVNAERIKELHPLFNGEYNVILRDGTELKSSRSYREQLRQHFDDAL